MLGFLNNTWQRAAVGLLSIYGSAVASNHTTNLGYLGRGFMRVSGEKVMLPKAIPDDRKMDYLFRDFFMTMVMAYTGEMAFRTAESMFVAPMYGQVLNLDKLSQVYAPRLADGVTANVLAPTYLDPLHGQAGKLAQLNSHDLPSVLRERMLGTVVDPNTRSYKLIPGLLEEQTLPSMQAELAKLRTNGAAAAQIEALEGKITRTQVFAHHIRRLFAPDEFLDTLVNMGRINDADKSSVQTMLKPFKTLRSVIDKLDDPKKAQEFVDVLGQLKPYSTGSATTMIDELLTVPKDQLVHRVKGYTFWGMFSPSKWDYVKAIKKDGFWQGVKNIMSHRGMSQQGILENLYDNAFKPMVESGIRTGALRHELATLGTVMSEDIIKTQALKRISQGGSLYVKLPLSLVTIFLANGYLGSWVDNHLVQPWQRKVVKATGNSKIAEWPSYISLIPTIAVFAGLVSLKPIKNLGYVGSVAVSGAAALGTYVASTLGLINISLKRHSGETFAGAVKSLSRGDTKPAVADNATGKKLDVVSKLPAFSTTPHEVIQPPPPPINYPTQPAMIPGYNYAPANNYATAAYSLPNPPAAPNYGNTWATTYPASQQGYYGYPAYPAYSSYPSYGNAYANSAYWPSSYGY